jgi:hypothetical protein
LNASDANNQEGLKLKCLKTCFVRF